MGPITREKAFQTDELNFIKTLKAKSKSSRTSFIGVYDDTDYEFEEVGCYGSIAAMMEGADGFWLEWWKNNQTTEISWKVYFITDEHLNKEVYDWVMEIFGHCFEPISFEEGMKNGWQVTFGKGSSIHHFWDCYHACIALRYAINYGLQKSQAIYDLFRPHCKNVQETVAFTAPCQFDSRDPNHTKFYLYGTHDHDIFSMGCDYTQIADAEIGKNNSVLFDRWPKSPNQSYDSRLNSFKLKKNKPWDYIQYNIKDVKQICQTLRGE